MKDSNCLFCKIIAGGVPSKKAFEDEDLYALHDIAPQAPIHILICTKKHIERVAQITEADTQLAGKMIVRAQKIAKELGVSEGFRLVFNNGATAGQSVWHLHLHLLGGRAFSWPPG